MSFEITIPNCGSCCACTQREKLAEPHEKYDVGGLFIYDDLYQTAVPNNLLIEMANFALTLGTDAQMATTDFTPTYPEGPSMYFVIQMRPGEKLLVRMSCRARGWVETENLFDGNYRITAALLANQRVNFQLRQPTLNPLVRFSVATLQHAGLGTGAEELSYLRRFDGTFFSTNPEEFQRLISGSSDSVSGLNYGAAASRVGIVPYAEAAAWIAANDYAGTTLDRTFTMTLDPTSPGICLHISFAALGINTSDFGVPYSDDNGVVSHILTKFSLFDTDDVVVPIEDRAGSAPP